VVPPALAPMIKTPDKAGSSALAEVAIRKASAGVNHRVILASWAPRRLASLASNNGVSAPGEFDLVFLELVLTRHLGEYFLPEAISGHAPPSRRTT
jgi:hypothetical protein